MLRRHNNSFRCGLTATEVYMEMYKVSFLYNTYYICIYVKSLKIVNISASYVCYMVFNSETIYWVCHLFGKVSLTQIHKRKFKHFIEWLFESIDRKMWLLMKAF